MVNLGLIKDDSGLKSLEQKIHSVCEKLDLGDIANRLLVKHADFHISQGQFMDFKDVTVTTSTIISNQNENFTNILTVGNLNEQDEYVILDLDVFVQSAEIDRCHFFLQHLYPFIHQVSPTTITIGLSCYGYTCELEYKLSLENLNLESLKVISLGSASIHRFLLCMFPVSLQNLELLSSHGELFVYGDLEPDPIPTTLKSLNLQYRFAINEKFMFDFWGEWIAPLNHLLYLKVTFDDYSLEDEFKSDFTQLQFPSNILTIETTNHEKGKRCDLICFQ
ncbi:unnamed protein product [Ambrosiozyma monospora]|uniref:Unnamed protein product n=1 Tax=Ambrosiozyma monospora TaxID=43982 RepID=A0ACB5SYB2_AMBMO|nr:unnamed protein product [Ambrosiozyma monospora]